MEENLLDLTVDSFDSYHEEWLVNRYVSPIACSNRNFCIIENATNTCAQGTLVFSGSLILVSYIQCITC